MRLASDTADLLPAEVARYSYDRDAQKVGIVHFGIGAFHRAHQAWYTDLAMDAGDRDWAICGVSLRSSSVAEQLNPQNGLYTVSERGAEGISTRLVGAVREVLFAPEQADAVIARIADPACHIVSFTVTEKGYARGDGGKLDLAGARDSFYPLLTAGLEQRRASGLPGLTLLPCDNLANNGRALASLMADWLAAVSPGLVDWFARECRVPSTMIDRIVPRTSPEDFAELEDRIGMGDRGAVIAERFSQWVIENNFAGPRPSWEAHGAQLVADVASYETAKLRMLNGAHSLLAYCGLRAGYVFVHEAVADPRLRNLANLLMREEAAPTITASADQDLAAYAGRLMQRFANPALDHRLSQIAMDGTQKIPQRWLDTALCQHERGNDVPAIRAAFDAWLWHLDDGQFVDDPLGEELQRILRTEGSSALVRRCFTDDAAVWPGYEGLLPLFER